MYEQSNILPTLYYQEAWMPMIMHVFFIVLSSFLVYGGVLYHFTRIGYFKRSAAPLADLQGEEALLFRENAPRLTILVPSYKEEPEVITQTLLSAGFQLYPNRRVVLLIDNPPVTSGSGNDYHLLCDARNIPVNLTNYFKTRRQQYLEAEQAFENRRSSSAFDPAAEKARLEKLWAELEGHFNGNISSYDVGNHVDRLFLEVTYERLAEIIAGKRAIPGELSAENIAREYRFLTILFDVEFESFERKRYLNLSHAANKAMNLNSYIGLCGGCFTERTVPGGTILAKCSSEEATLSVPATDYYITLDADSLIVPEYANRLIAIMEKPSNERLGIVQTPYSAVPEADNVIERVAGATTDIQYLIHQGLTSYNATYWVGANALIRAEALEDIKSVVSERGYEVYKYIQDRTVIEDTESSIDLADKKWTLHNHPERLAFSATPPDYGSLLIQRRRWANGGLLIMPKLLSYLFTKPSLSRFREGFFRVHYLISTAAVNIGMLLLMLLPFGQLCNSIWLPLTSLTYYILYARDLKKCGYKISDVFNVYALNLLLIPVNLGGVFKSIEQAFTGKHIPFARTPKIEGRTAASPLYIVSSYALFAQFFAGGIFSAVSGHLVLGIFSMVNAVVLLYAIISFIGLRESYEDVMNVVEPKLPTLRKMFLSTAQQPG
ncbi:MAG: glycosyl transferase [Chlorobiaceae bacterium]|nr:glycosyl transferase [Chlorobiaceae bacterium]